MLSLTFVLTACGTKQEETSNAEVDKGIGIDTVGKAFESIDLDDAELVSDVNGNAAVVRPYSKDGVDYVEFHFIDTEGRITKILSDNYATFEGFDEMGNIIVSVLQDTHKPGDDKQVEYYGIINSLGEWIANPDYDDINHEPLSDFYSLSKHVYDDFGYLHTEYSFANITGKTIYSAIGSKSDESRFKVLGSMIIDSDEGIISNSEGGSLDLNDKADTSFVNLSYNNVALTDKDSGELYCVSDDLKLRKIEVNGFDVEVLSSDVYVVKEEAYKENTPIYVKGTKISSQLPDYDSLEVVAFDKDGLPVVLIETKDNIYQFCSIRNNEFVSISEGYYNIKPYGKINGEYLFWATSLRENYKPGYLNVIDIYGNVVLDESCRIVDTDFTAWDEEKNDIKVIPDLINHTVYRATDVLTKYLDNIK